MVIIQGSNITHLGFMEDRAKAVEQLERRDNLALDKGAGEKRCCCPPPGANRHLPEPHLQRQPAAISHHWIHVLCRRRQTMGDIERSGGFTHSLIDAANVRAVSGGNIWRNARGQYSFVVERDGKVASSPG